MEAEEEKEEEEEEDRVEVEEEEMKEEEDEVEEEVCLYMLYIHHPSLPIKPTLLLHLALLHYSILQLEHKSI